MSLRFRHVVTALSLALLGAGITAASSSEAAITAFAGDAQSSANSSCFSNSNGRVTNSCASPTRQWCVSSYIGSSGTKTVRVNGRRPNGGSLSCHARSVSQTGAGVTYVSNALNVVDADTAFTIGDVSVPAYGGLYVCCDMSQNARVNTINF